MSKVETETTGDIEKLAKIGVAIKQLRGRIEKLETEMEQIKEKIELHERRISELGKRLAVSTEKQVSKLRAAYVGLPGRILNLRDDGFFQNPRTLSEVWSALRERGFYYDRDQVGMALLRLVRRKELRRVFDEGKKQFVYIYP